ncbi:hypothetical protein ANN_07226 [Periplaneta americana]|uniref:Uncharacterized protein n=1 Tax=Periplaneta americana TaxID=6978 RepID=A0ABQ8TFM7_PERAM|nr:hypothetical protein ANN_07226 [Periplaneta americana]
MVLFIFKGIHETLPHVLGFCHYGELFRNNRHHLLRTKIASVIKINSDLEVYEEVHYVASNGSHRCVDIIAVNRNKNAGYILDLCIRYETCCDQHLEVDKEKKQIYEPNVPKIWYSLLRLSKTAEGSNTNMDEYISVLANIIQPEVGIAAPPFHTAVLIPPGILYVGVPVTCTVSLRNYTSQNTSFKWGFPIGSDTDRLHVVVNPKCGEVRAESSLKVKVTVIPQDVGRIQSLYVPCFIEQEIIPVILSVEANIEGLNITFLLPKTEAETNSNNWLCFPWPPKHSETSSWNIVRPQGKVPGIETMTWSLPRMRSSFEAMKFSSVRALSDITLSSSEFGPNSSEEDLKRRLRYSRRGVKRSLDLSFIKVPHFEEDSLLSVPDLQEEVDLVSVSNVEFPLVHVPGIDGIPSIEFTPTYRLNLSTMSASKEEEVVVQEEEVNPEVEEEERNVKNNRKSRKKGKQLSEVQLSDHELMKNNSAILKDKSGSKKSKNSKINMKQKQKEVEDRFEDATYNIEQPEPKESDSNKQIESADGDNEEEDPQPTEEQLLSKVTLGTQFPSMTSSLSLHTSESSDTVDWPPVMVFTCLPCHKAIKKTFIVRNETPVLSALSFCVQNYCAKKSARELSLLQEVEMKVAGKHPEIPRKSAVAKFRLLTEHDYLAKHLNKIGIYTNPNCPLCNKEEEMTEDHLQTCEVLPDGSTTEKYWRARTLMASLPKPGIR